MAITRRRKRRGKGFDYFSASGKRIVDADALRRFARIGGSGIPPAYTGVQIYGPKAKLQATALDKTGRKQYFYSPEERRRADAAKFRTMRHFGAILPKIRRHYEALLADADADRVAMGVAIALLDVCIFRPGSEYYKDRNGSVGATTMERRHVTAGCGGRCSLIKFKGKKQAGQECSLKGAAQRGLKETLKEGGAGLPSVKEVARELKQRALRGEGGFYATPKMFRTFAANARYVHSRTKGHAHDEALTRAAKALGNTPKVCRKSYLAPAVIAHDFGRKKGDDGGSEKGKLGKLTKSERLFLSILTK